MDEQVLVGKIVADKNSRKLGRVYCIDRLPNETTKEIEPHNIVIVQQFLKKDLYIPIEKDKIIKIEGNYLWLDLHKEDFDLEIKKIRAIKQHRKNHISAQDQWKPSIGMGYASHGLTLQPRPKSKRKE